MIQSNEKTAAQAGNLPFVEKILPIVEIDLMIWFGLFTESLNQALPGFHCG